jgi:hypothetical protein
LAERLQSRKRRQRLPRRGLPRRVQAGDVAPCHAQDALHRKEEIHRCGDGLAAWPVRPARTERGPPMGDRMTSFSESRMRENCTSGSMSGTWKRSMTGLVRHRQTKGPETDRLSLTTAPRLDSTLFGIRRNRRSAGLAWRDLRFCLCSIERRRVSFRMLGWLRIRGTERTRCGHANSVVLLDSLCVVDSQNTPNAEEQLGRLTVDWPITSLVNDTHSSRAHLSFMRCQCKLSVVQHWR